MSFNLIKLSFLSLLCIASPSCANKSNDEIIDNQLPPIQGEVDYSKYQLNKFDKYLVMPSGAPTLAAHKLINEKKVNVVKDPKQIPALFSNGESPFVVFDSYKGQQIIKKQGDKAKYRFIKMLTGGNFHLFAFNKTIDQIDINNLSINENDYVLGFQQGGTPDLLFKYCFPSSKGCDVYLDSVSNLRDKLLSMDESYRIDRQVVDYAVVAEPMASIVKQKLTTKGLKVLDINLQTTLKSLPSSGWTKEYIPQAGLFIRTDIPTDEKSEIYTHVIKNITESINNVLSNPLNVKSSIEEVFADAAQQAANYGFGANVIPLVQGKDGKKNGFGIVPNEFEFTANDIESFNKTLNNGYIGVK